MNRQRLVETLTSEFGAEEGPARTVARQAGDLADSGRLAGDAGYDLTDRVVLGNLGDAPHGYTLVERWNWWVGSLELAYGDTYRRFRVRPGVE
ncbi:MAG: hypothetical protein J07HX64_00099 [halophilic archaeon J07HX64]|nr:MAG: hypothetical protein J07HX64_00099 [halophilic archaeon J07HX64]